MSEVLDYIDTRADLSKRAGDVVMSQPTLVYPDTLLARAGGYRYPGTPVEVQADTREPMETALTQVARLLALEPNWDTYGAAVVRTDVASYVLSLVAVLLPSGLPVPSMVATATGGIQMEWHQGGSH